MSKNLLKELLLFLAVFFIVFVPPIDADFWWHLKYGEIIFTTHSIPTKDTFSYTMTGYAWADSYWLSQLIMFSLFKLGGFILIPLVFSVILSLTLVFVTRPLTKNYLARFLTCLTLAIVFFSPLTTVRPLLFSSISLLILWSFLIFKSLEKYMLLLPLIFLLWANMHADFIIGLGILYLFLFMQFLYTVKNYFFKSSPSSYLSPSAPSKKSLLCLFVICILSILATLITPFKFDLYKTFLNEAHSMSLQSANISEWLPISIDRSLSFILFVVLIAFNFWVLVHVFVKKEKPYLDALSLFRPSKLLIFGVPLLFLPIAFKSVYFLRPFVIFSFPLIYIFFVGFLEVAQNIKINKYLKAYFCGVFFCTLLLLFLQSVFNSLSLKSISNIGKYPSGAVSFLKSKNTEEQLFSNYKWGGYLIYTIPEYKTFIDGRMPSWKTNDTKIFRLYLQIFAAKDQTLVNNLLDKYDVSVALLSPDDVLTKYLRDTLNWKVIYEDAISIVLEKVPKD